MLKPSPKLSFVFLSKLGMIMWLMIGAILITTSLNSSPANAGRDKIIRQTINVPLGRGFRRGPYYLISGKGRNCRAQNPPQIVIIKKPKIGTLKEISRKQKPRQAYCRHQTVKAVGVLYQSYKTKGNDSVIYEVRYNSKSLGTWRFELNINVK